MEVNTVVLSLGEYNALRDFRENLEKGNTYRTLDYNGSVYTVSNTPGVLYVTTDQAVKEVTLKNENLAKVITKLNQEVHDLKYPKKKELTINDVKKMSIWKFLKWRKQLW